jgi:hypothetical protein
MLIGSSKKNIPATQGTISPAVEKTELITIVPFFMARGEIILPIARARPEAVARRIQLKEILEIPPSIRVIIPKKAAAPIERATYLDLALAESGKILLTFLLK